MITDATDSQETRLGLGAAAFAVAGVLFLLYPAVRPWEDESTVEGATRAMGSGAWIASHVFAMIGFVLVGLGMLALRALLSRTRAERLAGAALVTMWLGAGLTLPYYGGETFGLYAIASAAGDVELLDVVDAFRFQPVAVTFFGLGLLGLAVGSVLAALAIRRSGVLPRHAGVAFALGFVLFLPQFFAPAAVRIGHGALVALGCGWIALALWRATKGARPRVRVGIGTTSAFKRILARALARSDRPSSRLGLRGLLRALSRCVRLLRHQGRSHEESEVVCQLGA